MQWLFLTLVTFVTYAHAASVEHDDYLECTSQTESNPGVCDCTGRRRRKCFIKLTLTRIKPDDPEQIDEAQLFSVNGGRIGPTIIVRYNQLIVADVYNEINDSVNPANSNISIHWHGMHQWNTDSMDGVGMITQWPTKPQDAIRYVLRAFPPGTHWYHSHMLFQRDEGILGALIVKDKRTENTKGMSRRVIDDPGETMLAIRDHVIVEEVTAANVKLDTNPLICEPDGSVFPLFPIFGNRIKIEPFRINGVKLDVMLPILGKKDLKPIFYAKRGRKTRFRIVGVMASNVLRVSIDKHKLQVIATDGYRTEPFETDILIVHIGERYDFILETNYDYPAGTVFPIRIETIAVKCNDIHKPEKVGYAYLQYTDGETREEPNVVHHYGGRNRCELEECTALNCPFDYYPPAANTRCRNVKRLRLLNRTPEKELPDHTGQVVERFFNFGFNNSNPVINGIQNELPENVPFVNFENAEVSNECTYEDTNTCKTCAHAVYLRQSNANYATFIPQTIRFVFSSISANPIDDNAINVATHPVHLHGHSYFVAKIGYPPYDENGKIIGMNPDITLPDTGCGPAHWTNGAPSGIDVRRRTVRKDVIIVPAGGYVVVEFLADNPGWWFLHCHIDGHSNKGMAVAVGELPSCQNPPQNDRYQVEDTHLRSAFRFIGHELFGNKCRIKRYNRKRIKTKVFSDEEDKQDPEMEEKSYETNMQNLRENTFKEWDEHNKQIEAQSMQRERMEDYM